jgi:AcrR family transcriptional regulator
VSHPVPRRRGRRPAGEDTRGAIVAAARTVFATKGYEAATLRGIARAAGVDPRLVHHYFAGKEEVFVEAMQFPVRPAAVLGPALAMGLDGAGERMARAFFHAWDEPAQRERVLGLLGGAMANPGVARMLREFVSREILARVASTVEGTDPKLRVELAVAQMIGVAMVRYVIQVEPIASAPVDQLVRMLAPTLQRYLEGNGGGGGSAASGAAPAPDVSSGPDASSGPDR